MKKRDIGIALDNLTEDVKTQTLWLVQSYRDSAGAFNQTDLIKQAVDSPARARAQVQQWIVAYNAKNGAGTAQVFLAECLTAAGSVKTVQSIDAELSGLQAQAQTVVNNVAGGWTWDQAATAIENAIVVQTDEDFSYLQLPVPDGYITVWGEPW